MNKFILAGFMLAIGLPAMVSADSKFEGRDGDGHQLILSREKLSINGPDSNSALLSRGKFAAVRKRYQEAVAWLNSQGPGTGANQALLRRLYAQHNPASTRAFGATPDVKLIAVAKVDELDDHKSKGTYFMSRRISIVVSSHGASPAIWSIELGSPQAKKLDAALSL